MHTLPDPTLANSFLYWNGTLWVWSSWALPDAADAGDIGDVLTVTGANAADWTAPPAIAGTKFLQLAWGCRDVLTGTRYPGAWCQPVAGADIVTSAGALTAQETGTLRRLYVSHGTPTAADPLVYTVMINDVATAITLNLSSGSTGPASDVANTAAVNVGDRITLRVTGATATRSVAVRGQLLLEYT